LSAYGGSSSSWVQAKMQVKNKFQTDRIWKAQMAAIQELECNLISLEKSTKQLKERVQSLKLENNFSQNEDCLRYALNIWRSCLRLAELKKLQWDLEDKDSNGKKAKN
jgi:uncharacterized protein YlxW (UPF0749 family)